MRERGEWRRRKREGGDRMERERDGEMEGGWKDRERGRRGLECEDRKGERAGKRLGDEREKRDRGNGIDKMDGGTVVGVDRERVGAIDNSL